MAAKKYFIDLNLNKNQITELSLENRNSDPSLPVSGEIYFNVVDKKIKFYDGNDWQSLGQVSADYVVYKGTLLHTSPQPVLPKTGDMYIFSNSGKAFNFGNQQVENGDFIIFNGVSWDVIQKNIDLQNATEEVFGIIKLASQAETDAGIDSGKAITPSTLEGFRINKAMSSVLLFENQTVTTSGLTLTHNLGNKNLTLEFYENNDKIILSYITPTINTIKIYSSIELYNINIIVIGCNLL